jgi:hypothetical protein
MAGKQSSPGEGKHSAREKSDATLGWSRWVRIVVSLLIVWHLFAVIVGPLAIQLPSQAVQGLARSDYMMWYLGPLYLNTGYSFFAPSPPDTMPAVHYRVVDAAGKEYSGQFPDLEKQWPRARYHRYMMLAEQIQLPIRGEPFRERVQTMLRVFARRLLREYNGVRVQIDYKLHDVIVDPKRFVTEELSLHDASYFRTVETITQTSDDLDRPLAFPHLRPNGDDWRSPEPPSQNIRPQ